MNIFSSTINKQYFCIATLLISVVACQNKDHSQHTNSGTACSHGHTHTGSVWEKIFHNHDENEAHSHHTHDNNNDDTSIFISERKQKTLGIEVQKIGKTANTQQGTLNYTGSVVRSASDHWEAIATVDGQLQFAQSFNIGDKIKKGTKLFTVSGKNFTEGNIEAEKAQIQNQMNTVKSEIELAKIDFERAEKAIAYKVISQDDFLHKKATYEQAKIKLKGLETAFSNVGKKYGNNTTSVYATQNGVLAEININEGSFVNTGTSVVGFTKNSNLLGNFQIPNSQFEQIKKSKEAIILLNSKLYKITEFNNKATIMPNNQKKGNYSDIQISLPANIGALVGDVVQLEVPKTINTENTTLSIPKTAVLEDFGLYYCYVATEKEYFEQRPLAISSRNNLSVNIESGLAKGENIVTKNPLQVKFSGVVAVGHSHNH